MAEVARVKTVVHADDVADELVLQLPDASREQAALLLAQLMLETANGSACYNNNVGNITSRETGAFYRPVWWEVTADSSPRLKQLHELMLQGKAPRAFVAYSSLSNGVAGYLDQLRRVFPTLLEASKTGDPQEFASAIRSSKYTPDAPAGVADSLASMQKNYLDKGMFESLPPLDGSDPNPPDSPEGPDSCC